jgi:hypothetical protein
MTSIEWLIKELFLEDTIYRYNLKVIEQAKEMHKQEIIVAYEQGSDDEIVAYDGTRKYNHGLEYYTYTYVSKGSDDHIADIGKMVDVPQQEISDEEIEKAKESAWSDYEYQEGNLYSTTFSDGWKMAIKWYREQLKH